MAVHIWQMAMLVVDLSAVKSNWEPCIAVPVTLSKLLGGIGHTLAQYGLLLDCKSSPSKLLIRQVTNGEPTQNKTGDIRML